MHKFLTLQHNKIRYLDAGQGYPLVFLHGYLESLSTWEEFIQPLTKRYRIIAFDIPGHGESETLDPKHRMETLAEYIYEALKKLNITRCIMIGHSMGGYLTLMFHHQHPEMLSGFSLFHSHPFADPEETKRKRLREIDLVKQGKKDMLAKINIPNAFAPQNLLLLKDDVEKAKTIALNTSSQGIIANLYAMMHRPDFSDHLSKTTIPFLLIAGKYDQYIPFDTMIPRIRLPEKTTLCILENSGHMGFVEEKEKTQDCLQQFANSCYPIK